MHADLEMRGHSFVVSIAPIGKPLPSAFAVVRMSGVTP